MQAKGTAESTERDCLVVRRQAVRFGEMQAQQPSAARVRNVAAPPTTSAASRRHATPIERPSSSDTHPRFYAKGSSDSEIVPCYSDYDLMMMLEDAHTVFILTEFLPQTVHQRNCSGNDC